MSEDPSPYFTSLVTDAWEPEFSSRQYWFHVYNRKPPTEAFICHEYRVKFQAYTNQIPTIADKPLPDLPEGSLGTYNGVVLYETSKPGITFA